MKLVALFLVVLFVGGSAQDSSTDASTPFDASTTPRGNDVTSVGSDVPEVTTTSSDNTPASQEPTESTTAGPTGPAESTTVGPTVITTTGPSPATDVTEPSDSTNASPDTTVVTETPTTTIPLNRNVAFDVDCAAKTSCSFKFTIDERLVRSINNTALEAVLSQLSTSINNASSNLEGLKYIEDSYSQYINHLIDEAYTQAEYINDQYNITSSDAEDLSSQTSDNVLTAQNYLKSALCFQNDADSSSGCGSLSGLS